MAALKGYFWVSRMDVKMGLKLVEMTDALLDECRAVMKVASTVAWTEKLAAF